MRFGTLGIGAALLSSVFSGERVYSQMPNVIGWDIPAVSSLAAHQGLMQIYRDFTGDGIPDMLTLGSVSSSEHDYRVFFAQGRGQGNFTKDKEILRVYEQRRVKDLAPGKGPLIRGQLLRIRIEDLTGDGNLDMQALVRKDPLDYPCDVHLMTGNGDGSFQAPQKIRTYGQSVKK